MPTEDAIWSIDFPGINEDAAEAIADSAKRLGLATDVIITDPDIFMTLHMDIDTVAALHEFLSQGQSTGGERTILTGLTEVLTEWLAARGAP